MIELFCIDHTLGYLEDSNLLVEVRDFGQTGGERNFFSLSLAEARRLEFDCA